jgi:transposase-like protein
MTERDDSAVLTRRLSGIEQELVDLQDTVNKTIMKQIEEIRQIKSKINAGNLLQSPEKHSNSPKEKNEKKSKKQSSSSQSSSSSSSSDSEESSSSKDRSNNKRHKSKSKHKSKGKSNSNPTSNSKSPQKRFKNVDGGEILDGQEVDDGLMESEYVPPSGSEKVFTIKGKLRFKCNECGSLYTRKDALQRHELSHSGARPFQCPHCESAFRSSANLIVHVQRKHGTPRHLCNLCGKRFVAPSLLRSHLNKGHRVMVENLKLCSVCQYSSYDIFEFNTHLNSHPPPSEALPVDGEEVPQDPEVLDDVEGVIDTDEAQGGEVDDDEQVAVPLATAAPVTQ